MLFSVATKSQHKSKGNNKQEQTRPLRFGGPGNSKAQPYRDGRQMLERRWLGGAEEANSRVCVWGGGPGAARPLPDMPGGRRHQAHRRRKWKMRLKEGVIQKKVKKEACPWGPWELAQPHSDPVAGGRSSGPGSPTRRHRGAVN